MSEAEDKRGQKKHSVVQFCSTAHLRVVRVRRIRGMKFYIT